MNTWWHRLMAGLGLSCGLAGCQGGMGGPETPAATRPATVQPGSQPIATSAADVRPLKEGSKAPAAKLRRPDGKVIDLAGLYSTKPTVLIFYRGGWCPYCNTHLSQIAKAESELIAMGFQVVAVSPDRPEELQKSVDKQHLTYQLLSDSEMVLAQAFGLAFKVDDSTVTKYRGFGIDLDKSSGRNHHLLPVPAVYIVDIQGIIRFAHWNPDYKQRLESKELCEAAKRVTGR